MTKKIAIIDGYGFVFRAYHSLPPLTSPDGEPVGAVYGFTNMLIKLIAGLNVSHVVIALDSGSKTFRNEIYSDYKANRPECPEDLKPQFPIVRKTAQALNIATIEKAGFEADDIIATIAKKSQNQGYEVLIVSSDKDLMQLVNDQVFMYDAMRNRFIGDKEVKDKFFVEPKKVLDVLSLIGDSSDNVPGVRGIGPKTAAELINEFGDLENLLKNYQKIQQPRKQDLIREGIENAKISYSLIKLDDDVDIGVEIKDLNLKPFDPIRLIDFLNKYGFRSLVNRIQKEFKISDNIINQSPKNPEISNLNKKSELKKIEVNSAQIINEILNKSFDQFIVTIDFFSNENGLDFITINPKTRDNIDYIYYFHINNDKLIIDNQTNDLFNITPQKDSKNDQFGIEILKQILIDDSIKKIFFNFKNFYKSIIKVSKLANYLNNLRSISFEDVHLMNHLLTSTNKNDLRSLIDLNLAIDIEENEFGASLEILQKNKIPDFFTDEIKKIDFLCKQNLYISKLYDILNNHLFKNKLNQSYQIYEKPLLLAIARMEKNGVKIDIAKMKNLSDEFEKKIKILSDEIFKIAGCEFNIASTKQLSEILFEKLGLTSNKKSKKTGALSTKSSVLEEMSLDGHEIADKILDFRKYSKLKNTYTDALPQEINSKTNRIHSHFSTTSTITGRLSSSNPNLQNIPIRSLDGKKIREAFIAENGKILISADYSQIELRMIAHIAKIDNLIQAFKEDKDIHKITASQIFKIPEHEVDDNLRSKAKAINFGIIYGISGFGLAKQLKISRSEAQEYIKSYLETYPGIDLFMKNSIDFAKKNGFVNTISGRKCFIHDINNKNPVIRNEAERLAINAPIQGSAADLIKMAMIKLDQNFIENEIDAKIIMQIHDELIIETPKENQQKISELVLKIMENAFYLDLPLKVDISCGEFWS